MSQDPDAFAGHASYSGGKLAYADSTLVAPADTVASDPDDLYDPADYEDEPGAPARANGYPRSDGRPN